MSRAAKAGLICLIIACVVTVYLQIGGKREEQCFCSAASNVGNLDQRRDQWLRLTDPTEEPISRLPDVIGIGARKCGTGTLQYFLSFHPLIQSNLKEIHYYDRSYRKGLEYYRRLLPNATKRQLVTEKTPAYVRSRPFDLPDIISKDIPNVKLWLILCNPATRAFSDFVMRKSRRNKIVANMTFQRYMDTYMPMVQHIFSGWSEEHDRFWNMEYIFQSLEKDVRSYSFAHGIYAYFLKRWLEVFSSEKLMIIDGEEFIHDPGKVIESLQEYLDIPKILKKKDFIQHPKTGLYCIRPWWISSYNFKDEYTKKTSWENDLVCSVPKKGMTRSRNAKFRLTSKQKETLRTYFEPYNQMLFKLLNRAFNW